MAETYELGAGAIRAAAATSSLEMIGSRLQMAIGGTVTASEAQRALPAAEFLRSYSRTLNRDLGEYADNLRTASNGVAQLKRYAQHKDLAKTLADLATYVENGAKKLPANSQVFVNALKSAATYRAVRDRPSPDRSGPDRAVRAWGPEGTHHGDRPGAAVGRASMRHRRPRSLAMPADFADRTDFDDADRGFLATLDPLVITGPGDRVIFEDDVAWPSWTATAPTPPTRACGARASCAPSRASTR